MINPMMTIATLLVAIGVIWRTVWLSAGLPDATWQADVVRDHILPAVQSDLAIDPPVQWIVVFDDINNQATPQKGQVITAAQWDTEFPVWVVAGEDGEPGWADWDDNGDGQKDDLQELGAAWSDDHCLVARELSAEETGRKIDQGAFVETVTPSRDMSIEPAPIQITVNVLN